MPKTELYIGNLGRDTTRKDIESVFDKYGRLLRCDVKDKGNLLLLSCCLLNIKIQQQRQQNYFINKIFVSKGFGTVYAFLEFEEERDAEVEHKCHYKLN